MLLNSEHTTQSIIICAVLFFAESSIFWNGEGSWYTSHLWPNSIWILITWWDCSKKLDIGLQAKWNKN